MIFSLRPVGEFHWRRGALAIAAAFAVSACDQDLELLRPAASDSTDVGDGGGGVQRASLTLTVELEGEAAQVASLIGFPGTGLPGADVSVRRSGDPEAKVGVTDAAGRVQFTGLLPGPHEFSVIRLLTAEETATLPAHLADVTAFGGGGSMFVEAPGDSASVSAVAGRRGSLVISELFQATPLSGNAYYRTGQYIELYNNSDSTIYLDGKILARGFWPFRDRPDLGVGHTCDALERWRLDPRGIWARTYVQFPGHGRQHSVQPGEAVLLAMDAIDHRPYAPGMHDLRHADFEYVGAVDVDNPAVPNLRDIGPGPWQNALGQGLFFSSFDKLLVIDGLDPQSLEREKTLYRDEEHHLMPAEKILDLISIMPVVDYSQFGPLCDPLILEQFDRRPARIASEEKLDAIQRRTLGTLPDGRVILQRTGTSAADLFRAAPSPGAVP